MGSAPKIQPPLPSRFQAPHVRMNANHLREEKAKFCEKGSIVWLGFMLKAAILAAVCNEFFKFMCIRMRSLRAILAHCTQ